MNDRTSERPAATYLRDPNYYRLAYQLAAQQAHEASSGDGQRVEGDDPTKTAEGLVADIANILGSFELRQSAARFRPKQALSVSELRLQRFLAGSVEPCVLLIIAGRSGDPDADPLDYVRARRPPRLRVTYKRFSRRGALSEIPWSYRAHYNLACCRAQYLSAEGYISDRVIATLLAGVLSALDQAFREVHGRARVELWRWAWKDPSLSPFREDYGAELFERIMREYAAPGERAPPSRDA
jgi:hypothetical protein